MNRPSVIEVERARRGTLAVSLEQRRELQKLALKTGISIPHVYSMAEAADAISRLKGFCGQPMLEGFKA